jgi:hypothetical protein
MSIYFKCFQQEMYFLLNISFCIFQYYIMIESGLKSNMYELG